MTCRDASARGHAAEEDGACVVLGSGVEHTQSHVALDGKTLRGTLGHTAADQQKMYYWLSTNTQTGVLLKEQVTGKKQNELSIVSAVSDSRVGQGAHHLG